MGNFTGFLNNAALMLVLCVIYDTFGIYAISNKKVRDVLTGVLVGLISIAVMLNPWALMPGVFFDTRWVLLSLCGLFFGLIPTTIAMLIAGAFRLYLGGAGGIVGTIVIVVTSCVGIGWKFWIDRHKKPLNWITLYIFGIAVQLAMLSCMFLMPATMRSSIFRNIALPILLIFPVLTVIVGLILKKQEDRRAADRKLLYSNSLATAALESSPDGILIVDMEGKIARWNQKFADLWKVPRNLLDTTVNDPTLAHAAYQMDNPDDFLEKVMQLYKHPEETSSDTLYLVDGRIFERYTQPQKIGNEIVGRFWSFRDITERKKVAEALRKSEETFRMVFNNAPIGLMLADKHCVALDCNQHFAEIFGASRQDYSGMDLLQTIPEGPVRQTLLDTLADDKVHYYEGPYTSQVTGKKLFLTVTSQRAGSDHIIVIINDITAEKQHEAELAKSRRLLAETEKLGKVGGWELYIDTGLLTWTDEIYAIHEVDRTFIPTVENGINFYAPSSRETIAAAVQQAMESGEPFDAKLEIITAKGNLRNVHTIGHADLEQRRVYGFFQDITALKQIEEALRQSEVTFRKLFEESSDAILLIDATGVFVECNQAALDLLKMSREQFLLLPPVRISPEFQPNGRRSDEAALDMIAQAYSKGLHRFDWTCVNAEGGKFIVEVSLMPITIKGQTMLYTTWRDITERKRSEEELKLSEQKYASIFKTLPDMVGITRMADGRFIEVNSGFKRWSGWEPEEVIGKSSLDLGLWTPEARAEALAILKREGYLEEYDFIMGTKSGEKRNALMYLTPITVNGEPCIYFMARDITDRVQADEQRISLEKQMLHAQKLESLGVLAGGIAHDFNNLLMAIMGNADLALMRLSKESPAVENLHRIEQASARAADLARQMLAYSGKGKFVVEPLDLNKLVEEMWHMLEVSISKKAVLRLNPYHPLPTVEADATQIRQIIMNLVINASEAIGDKSGVIAITTGCLDCSEAYLQGAWLTDSIPEGVYVYLEIADTGCGMDKLTQEKIFDPFFTTKFTGRGLGMAAVLGIVRGHKGAIMVYSELNKGTTFKILLPASKLPAELFNGDTGHDDWHGGGIVLLVDDEETVRSIGAEMLKELGFQVITANDGREALDKYQENPGISIVILDLTMPHMDGDQCFRELRQLDPDVKVIMSSGFSEQEVTQKFAGKGLAGFIQKPYKMSMLKETIQKI